MKRGEELKPGYMKTIPTSTKGKSKRQTTSLEKTVGVPEDIFRVPIPALDAGQCMIPDTMCLSFKFVNSNTKFWFLNNLGRLLVDRLSIRIQENEIYENIEEGLLEV